MVRNYRCRDATKFQRAGRKSVCNRVAWWGMVVAVASVRLDQRLAFGTLGAETLDGVVDGLDVIAFRQGDYGYLDVLNAECPAALLTVEMDVAVLDPADGGLTAAYLVFCGSAAVLERMNRVMFEQDVEGAEYRGRVSGARGCVPRSG